MDVVKVMGGLGNQLFQYAYGKGLGNAVYNIDWFKNCRERDKYLLSDVISKKISISKSPPTKNGYWQELKYTELVREEVIKEMPQTDTKDNIAIHVRRGDYLTIPIYVQLGKGYYDKAYEMMPRKKILVFSDDIPWCRENFKYPDMVFVDKPTIESFQLMRSCKYKIIANSTFSWWAAYSSEGEVVAPGKWFTDREFDIIPKRWIKV